MKLLPENFDRELFLREYWQKKPLLIRAGSDTFIDPVSPEELGGMACEDFIESRLVLCNPEIQSWEQRHGPFQESDLVSLPEQNYTLLVQSVDQWVDDVAALMEDFSFIPSWRIEDIMISYSTDGGNAGPHFDYYDVFLIQGMGRKRWQVGGHADSSSPLMTDSGMRLLKDFNVADEWILEPGDILYLPPNLAHYGVAIGKSMTYSLGFRTPSLEEILSGITDEIAINLKEEQRYVDENPAIPAVPGEIPTAVGQQLQQKIQTLLSDPAVMTQWFGKAMTQARYPLETGEPEESEEFADSQALLAALEGGWVLVRSPGSRFAFSAGEDGFTLFADGESLACPAAGKELVHLLCDPTRMPVIDHALATADTETPGLLYTLLQQGSLYLDN